MSDSVSHNDPSGGIKVVHMLIELRAVDSIRPYDKNPRKNDHAVEAVARSITDYGFRQPIVVDAGNLIVVGHTRWKAAQKLGLKQVPVRDIPTPNRNRPSAA